MTRDEINELRENLVQRWGTLMFPDLAEVALDDYVRAEIEAAWEESRDGYIGRDEYLESIGLEKKR